MRGCVWYEIKESRGNNTSHGEDELFMSSVPGRHLFSVTKESGSLSLWSSPLTLAVYRNQGSAGAGVQ